MERIWRPDWPCPAAQILLASRRGALDPTYRIDEAGRHWRGMRTPVGPATLMVDPRPGAGEVRAEAWGDGAEWALAQLPALLGADDDMSGFDARHPVLVEAQRRHPHWRIGRTGLVMEALVPSIIEQKVTGQEALAGFRQLVLRFGDRAPGPNARLWLQPSPDRIRTIPSWAWLELHVDPARSRAVVTAASRARALERAAADAPDVVDRKLRSLPGVGAWTSAEVRAVAFGDADAVSVGDYHVAKDVGWALLGHELDDEGLVELLEPWRPHRLRVQVLVGLARLGRPRRGPRMPPRTHLPGRTPGTR